MRGLRHFLAVLLLTTGAWHIDSPSARALDKTDRATIAGKIVDAALAPVSGAKVTLFQLDTTNPRWGGFKVARSMAATEPAGTYRFEGLDDGYFIVSVEREGFARALRGVSVQEHASQHADMVLTEPVALVIHVEDRDGKPVAGARVRELRRRGANGACPLRQLWMPSLGVSIPPSDDSGDLRLPPLPSGETITATLEHSTLAPVKTEAMKVASGSSSRVTMSPGVTVTLHVPVDSAGPRITHAVIDLRHQPFDDPSTVIHYDVGFDREGRGKLTVAEGDYSWLLLQHEDYFITPVFSANYQKKAWLRIAPGRNQGLHFDVRRKVKVPGRVVDADTGKPVGEMSLKGELSHGTLEGWTDRPGDAWSFGGWAETDADGRYTIELAAGKARVSFEGDALLPEHEYEEVTVATAGSTVIPDFKVRAQPKVSGVVKKPDGSPAVRAVVRLRSKFASAIQPVLTDSAGRFELQPRFIPLDPETGKRLVVQSVVAFDPYQPLAGRAEVRLDSARPVAITLEPHEPAWPLSAFSSELSEWERGTVSADQAAKNAAISLRGQTPPELDSALWINTENRPLALADLRGKYVLLDFWFTGCGPCHADFPSMQMVHDLYKDKVVVIGVHNNSSTPEAVRAHVAKIGLPFPIAVDHADGRTVARFEEHGVPNGYPNYILIGPDGKVRLDDSTIPHPSLRGYKLEIIRALLLEARENGS